MTETAAVTALCADASEATTVVRQIAHELRQPLSTIESIAYYLDLILPREDGKARVQLERLQRMVEQSNWIVSNAVHYMQTTTPAPQCLDLSEILGAAAAECAIDSKLSIDVDHRPFLVRLDPGQAMHLFTNLLTFFQSLNAGISVSAFRSLAVVELRFFSRAAGHRLQEVRSLFEPFSPGLPAGSGLSLASVRRIVEAHRGFVEVDADPDQGVRVTLTLPV